MRAVLQPPRPNPCVGETSTNPDTERIGTPLVIRCSYTLEGRSCALGTGYAQLYDSANPAASPLVLVHILAWPRFLVSEGRAAFTELRPILSGLILFADRRRTP